MTVDTRGLYQLLFTNYHSFHYYNGRFNGYHLSRHSSTPNKKDAQRYWI